MEWLCALYCGNISKTKKYLETRYDSSEEYNE